jgi:cation diffusion facilitator CzcD-associated flavoprotein CzcO
MTASSDDELVEPAAVFARWVGRFGAALESGDARSIAGFFAEQGYWRDTLAFTWTYRTYSGPDEILDGLRATLSRTDPSAARLSPGRSPARQVRRAGNDVLEGFFDFTTTSGRGTAFVRLFHEPGAAEEPTIWLLLTTLQELRGFEEKTGSNRPSGTQYSRRFAGNNWLDERNEDCAYADRDPDVLIVGGGQCGLITAARLRQVGVDVLVIEKHDRIGDNWRGRYHSLTLHNEVWSNHLPYMPFPETWPRFLPKDMIAMWLEAYAPFMELNVWTGTEFVGGDYDADSGGWDVRLRDSDGQLTTMHPGHVVLATGGVSGIPNIATLPGLEDFEGLVVHSSRFTSGADHVGRHAIVVGTGTSAHDVAQDLHANGAASVTMVQRSPTCVVSLEPSGALVYAIYSEGISVDDADMVTAAIPLPVLVDTYQWITRRMADLDAELLTGLERAGFRLTAGPDGTGFHMLYLQRGGGYYIDVGCSELISGGEIALAQMDDIAAFESAGLRMADGTLVPGDLVVLATGYRNLQEEVRRLFGDVIADRVGPVWGFDENQVMRNVAQKTAQDGFWIMAGSLVDVRPWSRYLALLIKAELEGFDMTPPERIVG